MKCFHHPESDAVGLCTCCSKAVCRECAVDLKRGLACKGACEIEVRRMLDLRDFSLAQPTIQRAALRQGKMAHIRGGITLILMGAFFGVMGYVNPGLRRYMLPAAAGIILLGLWSLASASRRVQPQQFRLCPTCGYNISGNTTNKCPECGGRT